MSQPPPFPDATPRRIVTEILAARAGRDPATLAPDDRIESLGLDSLAMAEVIFDIEERFDLAVPFDGGGGDGDGVDLSTVGAVIAALEALLAQNAA